MSAEIVVQRADLSDPQQQATVVDLIDQYSRDPMGSGEPLPAATRQHLGPRLAAFPGHEVFVAWIDQQPAGVAVCFTAFSTFLAKPIINVHDLAVIPAARGQGLGAKLLEAVEAYAREKDYGKLTLEVLEQNEPARRLYRKMGFAEQPTHGQIMLFCSKTLGS